MLTTVLFLGLIDWVATTIVVESELTAPIRDWLTYHRDLADDRWATAVGCVSASVERRLRWTYTAWAKARYLACCHLCAGTWVGLALAGVLGSPWSGFVGWIAGGLLVKAVGHLILELRPQAWWVSADHRDRAATTRSTGPL